MSMLEMMMHFSHTYCVSICGFFMVFNVLGTGQTVLFTGLNLPSWQIKLMASMSSLFALVIISHVFSWFVVGVVQWQTFVLLFLCSLFLAINIWAFCDANSQRKLLNFILMKVQNLFKNLFGNNQLVNSHNT